MISEGNTQSSESERIERLRMILEQEQGRPVTYGEALEVGESLISFYEVLADDTEPTNQGQLVLSGA
jgi:hypothetical protein